MGPIGIVAALLLSLLPQGLAAQQCLYFANQIGRGVAFVDPQMLSQAPAPLAGVIPLIGCPVQGCRPERIAFSPDQAALYVTDPASVALSVLNTDVNQLEDPIRLASAPRDVVVSSAGTVYVAVQNNVAVIDPSSATVVDTFPVGFSATAMALSPDDAFLYLAVPNPSPIPGTVSVVDVAAGEVVDSVDVGIRPVGVAFLPDGAFAYVTNSTSRTVSVIDTATPAVVDTVDVGAGASGIAASPDGSAVYVTNTVDNTVSVIDTGMNEVVDTLAVGSNPVAVVFAPDGDTAYVANQGTSNNISVIDTQNLSVFNAPSFSKGIGGISDLALADAPCAVIPTPTATPTATQTRTATITPTVTPTEGATATDTVTPTPTPTPSGSPTSTSTPGVSPTATPTGPATATPTATPSSPLETVTATPSATPTSTPDTGDTPTATPETDCVGDCNDDATVTTGELILGVNIAFGRNALGLCVQFDVDDSGVITIDELVAAVADATGPCA
jgi:YVTN family beta-propeller protein